MLEVRQLSRNYGSFVAVDNVSFSIDSGEIVGLLGHNGAGKTTIMKTLSGYLEPDAGSITVSGLDLVANLKQLQASLGYLPESLPVYPDMVVADYLDFAAELKGLRGVAKFNDIRRVVEATRIGEKLLATINTLSRGFKQRVGVAQAILGKPALLILDEPTNGLDPTQTDHMRELIRELADSATVILSTHIMQEVEAVCDRVLILRSGRLAIDSRLHELRDGGGMVITTSLSPEQVAGTPGLDALLPLQDELSPGTAGASVYRLEVSPELDVDAACARVARLVHEAGGSLYRMEPERRDLESLFRDVNGPGGGASVEGTRNAA